MTLLSKVEIESMICCELRVIGLEIPLDFLNDIFRKHWRDGLIAGTEHMD